MSQLREKLARGQFVVTGEVGPPKGVELAACLAEATAMGRAVTAINVTDLQSAVLRVGSMAVSAKLVERGMEPIFQLSCRDRNRLALQSDLLSARVFGVEDVLCITGDHPILGDHAEAKLVYDLDSVQLLKAASMLNQGMDMAGHSLDSSPDFFLGAVVTPMADPVEPQIIKMRKKIDAGARFFQTQAVYEPERFEQFMKSISGFGVPVIAGIVLLKSAAMARYMNSNVAGIRVPEGIIKELEDVSKADRRQKTIEITARIIRRIRPLCQGVHLMPMGWGGLVPEIIEQAGLN